MMGAIERIAIAGGPVQLPHDHHAEKVFAAVLDHVLVFRPVIRLGGISAVNMMTENRDAVFSAKAVHSRSWPSMLSSR